MSDTYVHVTVTVLQDQVIFEDGAGRMDFPLPSNDTVGVLRNLGIEPEIGEHKVTITDEAFDKALRR